MKVYTKTGDSGTTALIGGTRVPKFHPRIEAYGTVDELVAFLGLLRDQDLQPYERDTIIFIQGRLMNIASILAADQTRASKIPIPGIADSDIVRIEKEIDRLDAQLQPLTLFVIPGGNQTVSFCHVCRTVCRRAERLAIKLAQEIPIPENATVFLNRLSDYLFVLSRKLAHDLKVTEVVWNPNP